MDSWSQDEHRAEIDTRVEAFEAAWDRNDGAEIGSFLPESGHPRYLAILCELVRVDLELRWGRGERFTPEHYRDRYPDLFDDPDRADQVLFEHDRLCRQSTATGSNTQAGIGEPLGTTFRPLRLGRPCDGDGSAVEEFPSEHAELIRDLHRSDPMMADRLSIATANWPTVGGWFVGFRLDAELGRGAFGRVFLARQGDLADRPVALKVAPDMAGESRMLARLQHTNVVPIYSIHRSGVFEAVCMPYLGSTTLADVIANLGRQESLPDSGAGLVGTLALPGDTQADMVVPDATDRAEPLVDGMSRLMPPAVARLRSLGYVEAVLSVGSRLAEGLAHAHERGIVHRDLKPANVLFADDGEPMLLDFNLAVESAPSRAPAVAMVGGTLPYMAPEQIRAFRGDGSPVDGRADLYALGVILFELLAGRPPFPIRRGPIDAVLGEMLEDRQGPPPSCRRFNPAVTPAVDAIMAKLLEPTTARRYQTARELGEDIQRHLDDLPLQYAAEPSWRERSRKWARRHPRLSSSSSVALVALIFILILIGGLWSRHRRLAGLEAAESAHRLEADLQGAGQLLASREVAEALGNEGIALSRQAVGRYGADGPPTWLNGPLMAPLAAPDRARVRLLIGDFLLIWARAVAWRAEESQADGRTGLLAEAGGLLDRAEAAYGAGASPRAAWTLRADLARLAGDPMRADQLLREGAGVPLRSPREFLLEAEGQIGQGQFEVVRTRLQEADQPGSDYARVALLLAQGYANRGQFEAARRNFDLVINLHPDWPWPILLRGGMELKANRPREAAADFDRALTLRPGLVDALINRGLARLALADSAGAVADLSAALAQPTAPSRAWFIRATARERLGDAAGAQSDHAEGLRRIPNDHVGWVARAVAKLPGDPQGALADIDKALRRNPRYFPALQNRAAILSESLGRTDEAITLLDRTIGLHPHEIAACTGRGILLARVGRRSEAHEDARKAQALDRGPETLYRVAGIYALTARTHPDDARKALRLLAAAIGREPSWLKVVPVDPDLEPIRGRPDFQALIAALTPLGATE